MTCEALTCIAEKKEHSSASTKGLTSSSESPVPFSGRRASLDCNRGAGTARTKDARDAGIKRIDVLRARYAAGLPFAQTEVDELGLGQVRLRTGELVSVSIERA